MQALRSRLAYLLLCCLLRTLLPEAWVLALHPHAHTTTEPAHKPTFRQQGKALLSAKHQHCTVEQFYNAAYEAVVPVPLPQPPVPARYAVARLDVAVRPPAARLPRPLDLRGPPQGA